MAVLHRAWAWRTRPRDLGGRLMEDWRRARVDDWRLRSGNQPTVLADGQSFSIQPRRGRAGDNLYSNSLLALDADTGKLNWYFQFTKHDEHDWDATQVPVLIEAGGKKLIAQADRNGYFYVIDRATGKLVSATAYAKTTWTDSKDAEGRPVANKNASPTL